MFAGRTPKLFRYDTYTYIYICNTSSRESLRPRKKLQQRNAASASAAPEGPRAWMGGKGDNFKTRAKSRTCRTALKASRSVCPNAQYLLSWRETPSGPRKSFPSGCSKVLCAPPLTARSLIGCDVPHPAFMYTISFARTARARERADATAKNLEITRTYNMTFWFFPTSFSSYSSPFFRLFAVGRPRPRLPLVSIFRISYATHACSPHIVPDRIQL